VNSNSAILKKICVVDFHHEVIRPWAEFRRGAPPPPVVTLDHHTDVLPAFGRRAGGNEAERSRRIAAFDFRSDAAVAEAIAGLRHDEHLDFALRTGLIARSVVVAHENFTVPAHPGITICRDAAFPDPQTMLNDPEVFRPVADRVLESEFLARNLAGFALDGPFILDLDLDYFATAQAARPRDAAFFRRLAAAAGLITVSREADWVRLLRLPGETISAASLLDDLRRLLG
jgi:hypothetical protein